MVTSGHAVVTGVYQEKPDKDNIFKFEIETDQTFLLPVIQSINNLKKSYGGMQGIT